MNEPDILNVPVERAIVEHCSFTAVLFVGGLSQRMGRDKATLLIEGEPLWSRQLRLLRELKPEVLFISARERPTWCPPEVECIFDEPPSRGPLSGLAVALQKAKTSHVLALAVDLPLMEIRPLRHLYSLATPGCGVVPLRGDLFEPLCAVYPKEAAGTAAAALNADVFSLQSFARTLCRENRARAYSLSDSEQYFFHNANTPGDLETRLSPSSPNLQS